MTIVGNSHTAKIMVMVYFTLLLQSNKPSFPDCSKYRFEWEKGRCYIHTYNTKQYGLYPYKYGQNFF